MLNGGITKKKITVQDLIVRYLRMYRAGKIFRYHMLQDLQTWAHENFGVLHNIGTYDRQFRALKNNSELLSRHNLELLDISELYPDSKETTWRIIEL